jgi:hypothetical protein
VPLLTIELNENERLLMIFALGSAHGCPAIVSDRNAPPATTVELAQRLMRGGLAPAPAVAPQPPPAMPSEPPHTTIPAGATELVITPDEIAEVGKRLVIRYRSSGTKTSCSCWEKNLFDRVRATLKRPTVFFVKESKGYLNVVGIK